MVLSLMAFVAPFLNSVPGGAVLQFLKGSKALAMWATEDRLARAVLLVTASELVAGTGTEAALVASAMVMGVAMGERGQVGDKAVEPGGQAGPGGAADPVDSESEQGDVAEVGPEQGTGQDGVTAPGRDGAQGQE